MSLKQGKVAGTPASSTASASNRSRCRQRSPCTSFQEATPVIQQIYNISRDVFAMATPGFLPLPSDVTRLSAFLNGLTLQDVGLDASMSYFRPDEHGRPKVTYLHFADSPRLSFGVFCLPESAVIPLHDHPGMTVFSKILLGSMHIKSYDWVKAPADGNQVKRKSNGARLAKLNTDAVFDASSETVVLYPEDGGNLHCFTATSPCAVLDVMGPPYCQEDGRDCTYYGSRARAGGAGNGQYAWLKQVQYTFQMNSYLMQSNIQK